MCPFLKSRASGSVVEAARAGAIIEMAERAGAKGYTVAPNVNDKDARGIRDAADLPDVFPSVLIVIIASARSRLA